MKTKPSINPLKIMLSDKVNRGSYCYKIYYNLEDHSQEIIVRFLLWKNDSAGQVEIIQNTIPNFEIMSIEIIKQKKCHYDDECNELQIKGRYNKLMSTPPGTKFTLSELCNFKNVQIMKIQFTEPEIVAKLHLKQLCSNCYIVPIIPETKGGRVIVGG